MTSEIEDSEQLSIQGLTVNITINGENIIGDVFYYDTDNKLLVVKENFVGGESFNLRYVNAAYVDELKIVSKSNLNKDKAVCDLDKVNYQELWNQGEKNLDMIKKKTLIKDEKIIRFFDLMSKQYTDAEWEGNRIVLRKVGITIQPPYTPESCSGDQKSQDYIKKIVKKMREKCGLE